MLIARKFDGSKARRYPGRPRVERALEDLVVRMAKENIGWGYDRIVGALANLGYTLLDETVRNILRRNGIPPAPERKRTTTWAAFTGPTRSLPGTLGWITEILRSAGRMRILTIRGGHGDALRARSLPAPARRPALRPRGAGRAPGSSAP